MVKKDEKTKEVEKITETVEEKAEEVTETNQPESPESMGFFVYLGPSIRGVIQNASIYNGSRAEVEQFLAGAIEQFPRIRRLLIPGEILAEERQKIRTPGNALYIAYKKLAADVKNKEG